MVEEKFEKMVANARGEDNGEGFIITDEHVERDDGRHWWVYFERKCPLTGIELKDLQLVAGAAARGIVYEKAQVLTFLGKREEECPEALRNHVVTKEELKVSEKADEDETNGAKNERDESG